MKQRTLASTLKDLFLALLNASLILLAVCLWLAWGLADAVNSTASDIAESMVHIEPLQEDFAAMTAELEALRKELEALDGRSTERNSQTMLSVQKKLDALDAKTTTALESVQSISSRPEELIDYTIDQISAKLKTGVQGLLSCQRQEG